MKGKFTEYEKWWIALSAICMPVGALVYIFYMSYPDNSLISDNPDVYLNEIKKQVPIGTPGCEAFKVMQSGGSSCEVGSSSYGKFMTCERTDWFLPGSPGSNKGFAYFQFRQGKVYTVKADVYPD